MVCLAVASRCGCILPPHPVAVAPPCHHFNEGHGGDNLDEELLYRVLGQGGHCAGVLAITIAGVEVVTVDVVMEG